MHRLVVTGIQPVESGNVAQGHLLYIVNLVGNVEFIVFFHMHTAARKNLNKIIQKRNRSPTAPYYKIVKLGVALQWVSILRQAQDDKAPSGDNVRRNTSAGPQHPCRREVRLSPSKPCYPSTSSRRQGAFWR